MKSHTSRPSGKREMWRSATYEGLRTEKVENRPKKYTKKGIMEAEGHRQWELKTPSQPASSVQQTSSDMGIAKAETHKWTVPALRILPPPAQEHSEMLRAVRRKAMLSWKTHDKALDLDRSRDKLP